MKRDWGRISKDRNKNSINFAKKLINFIQL